MFNPEFLATENNDPNDENDLIQYLQKQSPEVLQRVAKSASEDIQEIIRHNVCLLYTSPSPRDRTRSRMPSSA